jgi:Mitotic checkpoint regulator, MAD2B-interacting
MGLVDYSDSDASDVEEKPAAKPATTSSKSVFQKVVDRSNPGKIRVSLPQATLKDETTSDEPPTKRAKTGGGAFSGFNSFLPPPKRAGQTNATLGGENAAKKGGLGVGVSLKTGSAPGFSREPEPEREYVVENESGPANTNGGSRLSLPPPRALQVEGQKNAEEVKLVGKPLMFKPLSVSRKLAKKKKVIPGAIPATVSATPATPEPKNEKPASKPKVSLFSMAAETEKEQLPAGNGEYQPMMLEVEEAGEEEEADSFGLEPSYEDYTPTTSHIAPPAVPTPPVSQSLDDIAGDLKLSAAERRQLFGRQKGGRGQAATKVINFNTDQEYLHNEELRAAGEQAVHNPVRAIAPGKHSLKQLVNAAQSQKEALEESFAKGKSNRAEVSSRYGW